MKGIVFGNWMIRPTGKWQGVNVKKFEMFGDMWTAVRLGYVARLGDKRLRRPTLMKCARAVMKEWVLIA